MLPTIYSHEYFIHVERVSVALMPSLKPLGVFSAELNAPEAYRFVTDGDTPFREQILYVSVTHIESVIDPNHIADNFRWKSVSLINSHPKIIVS